MKNSTQQTIEAISEFLQSINNDNSKQTSKLLAKFTNKSCFISLSGIMKKFIKMSDKIKKLEQEKQQYYKNKLSLEVQFDGVTKKNAELQKKISIKNKLLQNESSRKGEMMELLQIGNLDMVIGLSNEYKQLKIQRIAQQLSEYRWMKIQIDNENGIVNPQKFPQFSVKGKQIKALLIDNRYNYREFNNMLLQALQSLIYKDMPQINLPDKFFTENCRQSIERLRIFVHTLKAMKKIDQQNYRKKMDQTSQKTGISKIKYISEDFDETFDKFLDAIVDHINHTKSQQENIQMTLNRTKSLQNKRPNLVNYLQLADKIVGMISQFSSSFFDLVVENAASLEGVITLFRNLLYKLKGFEESVNANKEILAQYMKESSATLLKIHNNNSNIIARLPSLKQVQINKVSFEANFTIFEENLKFLLQEYDKIKQLKKRQSKNFQVNLQSEPEIQILNLTNICQSKKKSRCTIQIEECQCLKDQIKSLQNQIDRLTQVNNELVQYNNSLKQAFEQEYKIKDMHKNNNQLLISRIKVLQGIRSCIINAPIIDQNSNFSILQEKIEAVRLQNEKLKNKIEQKQLLLKYCEQSRKKLQTKKTEEVQKWKEKYQITQRDIEELQDRLFKLNILLEEKISFEKSFIGNASSINKEELIKSSINNSKETIKQQKEKINQIIDENIQEQQFRNQQPHSQETNRDKEKIKQLEDTINQLKKTNADRQRYHTDARSREKKYYEQITEQLKQEKNILERKYNELSIKSITYNQQNIKYSHLFTIGSIFEQTDYQERLFLIQNLVSYVGPIKKARLLYRADPYNKCNFHKYIDKQKHIVVIFKTIYGKMIAGYSEEAFDPNGIKLGYGMILSLWAKKVFTIKDKKAITYDDYFMIFGNSELRIKSLEFKLFSNFGIANAYYDNRGEKVHSILGQEKEREVQLAQYEYYALEPAEN